MAARRPLRFGIMTGMNGARWHDLLELWKFLDEAWSTVAAIALATKRLRVGPMVSGNTYRHPAVLANMVATIDHISGGRVDLGLGAGWMKVEHDGYGIPLPGPKERLDRLDEALQVIKLLFTERRANFQGQYYQLNNALC